MAKDSLTIRRNDLCYCGSNLKYKKCCLNKHNSNQSSLNDDMNIKQIGENQQKKLKKLFGNKIAFEQPNSNHVKLSEVICEFVKKELDISEIYEQRVSMICLACMAWNLSFWGSPDQNKSEIKKIAFKFCKDQENREKIEEILYVLIKRKLQYYGSIDRFIVDYQITNIDRDNFYLNIMSTISSQEGTSKSYLNTMPPLSTIFARLKKFIWGLLLKMK